MNLLVAKKSLFNLVILTVSLLLVITESRAMPITHSFTNADLTLNVIDGNIFGDANWSFTLTWTGGIKQRTVTSYISLA